MAHAERLFLVHDGFNPDDPYQAAGHRIMGGGWVGVLAGISEAIDS